MRIEQLSWVDHIRGMKQRYRFLMKSFRKVESLERRMKKSPSELFSKALAEYVARHAPDHVTESMDKFCSEIGIESDDFTSVASRRVLERVEW